MRTDVKIGLICLFAIVLGVIFYFVMQGKPQTANGNTAKPAAAGSAAPGAPTNHSDALAGITGVPPLAAGGIPEIGTRTLASAGAAPSGTGSVGGGIIAPPGSPVTPAVGGSTNVPTGTPAGSLASPVTSGSIASASTPGLAGGASVPSGPTLVPSSGSSTGTGSTVIGSTGVPRPTIEIGPSSGRTETPGSLRGSGRTGSVVGSTENVSTGTATTYKIQKGDMLGTIARKFNVTVKAIEAVNPGIDSVHLKIDAPINIPAHTGASSTSVAEHRPTSASGASTTRPASSGSLNSHATGSSTTANGAIKPGETYTVKKGDTLISISLAAYGSKNSWQRIYRANRGEINDPDIVPQGTVLRIPQ